MVTENKRTYVLTTYEPPVRAALLDLMNVPKHFLSPIRPRETKDKAQKELKDLFYVYGYLAGMDTCIACHAVLTKAIRGHRIWDWGYGWLSHYVDAGK